MSHVKAKSFLLLFIALLLTPKAFLLAHKPNDNKPDVSDKALITKTAPQISENEIASRGRRGDAAQARG